MSVFRKLLPKARWADPSVPERSDTWSVNFQWRGRQIIRDTKMTRKADAEAFLRRLRAELASERAGEVFAAFEASKLRRTGASLGQVVAAYLDPTVELVKDEKQRRRNVADLRLVVAWARDLWAVHEGGVRGVKIGAQIADARRIDALPVSVLTAQLVRDYYRARSGGTLAVTVARAENRSINSTLGHARDVFSAKARAWKFEELALPDLTGFLKEPYLPEEEARPEPLKAAQFAAMLAAAAAVGGELELVNRIFRQTGMRSGSVRLLRGDWLEELEPGVWWVHVRERKGGTAEYSVPVSPELAADIRARGPGFTVLPDGTETQRAAVVNEQHNEFLKGVLSESGRGQGNHRLRDTVATILLSWLGIEAAKRALGHADEKTTLRHYANLQIAVTDEMRAELQAFTRLRTIPFQAVG